MRLQDIAYALKAAADVAHAGEQLVGSLDRTRSHGRTGSVLFGIGVGLGLGALLFSEPARKRVQTWLFGAPVAVRQKVPRNGGATVEPSPEIHEEAAPAPH